MNFGMTVRDMQDSSAVPATTLRTCGADLRKDGCEVSPELLLKLCPSEPQRAAHQFCPHRTRPYVATGKEDKLMSCQSNSAPGCRARIRANGIGNGCVVRGLDTCIAMSWLLVESQRAKACCTLSSTSAVPQGSTTLPAYFKAPVRLHQNRSRTSGGTAHDPRQ